MKSLRNTLRGLLIAMSSLMAVVNLSAANYIQPDSSRELFRLEKIPLQEDRMKDLSRQLIVLAKRPHDGNAINQRSTAMLLSLASHMNPYNMEVRELNRQFSAGQKSKVPDANQLNKAKTRITTIKRWLSHPKAGKDANLLSVLLDDATKILQPETANNKDLGDWKNTIAPLRRYASKPRNTPPQRREDDKPTTEDPFTEEDPKEKPAVSGRKFQISLLKIEAPFLITNRIPYVDKKTKEERTRSVSKHKIAEVELRIVQRDPEDDAGFTINRLNRNPHIDNQRYDPLYRQIRDNMTGLVNNRYGNTGHHRMFVNISGGSYARPNDTALTGPVAVMLESSITNKELRDDLLVCADVDSNGKLQIPDNFWSCINHLRKTETKGRLIIPAKATDVMMQVLVFNEPEFFTRWDVFRADNLNEVMAVAGVKSDAKLVEADDLYDTVRNLTRNASVASITKIRAVRSRLEKIASMSPNHLSSRALLLYGSEKRPHHLSKEGLAHALLEAATAMQSTLLHPKNLERPSPSTMKTQHEQARALIDPVERLVDRSNNALYSEVLELANDFRSFSNLIKRNRDEDEWTLFPDKKVLPKYRQMTTKAQKLVKKTRIAAGYPQVVVQAEENQD
ncbi:MAG: hypothetical protein AB8F34_13225 [Akkermansiaceae bacterium]